LKQSWLLSALFVVAVAAISYGVFRATRSAPLPEGFLYANGHVEGTEIRISSDVPGRVVEHSLIEGQSVTRWQTIVVIEAQTSVDLLHAARAESAALRESRAAIQSQIELWTHHAETAQRQLARVRGLRGSNLASEQDVDQAENALRDAQEQVKTLGAQGNALNEQIASAQARVRVAETRLGQHEVKAPADGSVIVRAVETGEVIQAGEPLGLIVDLARLELKVYVPERDIGKVRLGNPARVAVNAFPGRYFDARVARIDDYAQFTPRDIHMPEERTRMVYGVTLGLDNSDGRLKPGMPADTWIRWDNAKSWESCCPIPGARGGS
jgi:HlyD family secretion protein